MYCVVMFVVFIFSALGAADPDKRKCHKLHPAMMYCCTGLSVKPEIDPETNLKECFVKVKPPHPPSHPPPQPPPPPPSCDLDECLAQKLGYYGEDGNIDKEVLTTLTEKTFENQEEMLTAVKDKCLNGDISKYGPPDMCDFKKMKHCFHNQFLKVCPEWSEEGECKGIKDLIPDCTMDD